ncbi:hypothetical protein Syun_022724 [Stephania yunnanensis]|uniref:Uncharacterized protein n=1 Tax=Stephania yunnanensis TaxID=152371 RepID=A0AAP0FE11_9MAGN
MGGSVHPLVLGRVIGDVVDMFVPTVSMSVCFGSKHVTNGCDIKPSLASAAPPKVLLSGHPDSLYCLVSIKFRKEVLEYMEPKPAVGIHRYILVLFRQNTAMADDMVFEQPASRANFSSRSFAAQLGLGLPVATVYFNAQKEPASKKR